MSGSVRLIGQQGGPVGFDADVDVDAISGAGAIAQSGAEIGQQAPAEGQVVRHAAGFDPETAPVLGEKTAKGQEAATTTLQHALNAWRHRIGDRPIGTEGAFGPGTKKAILAFQRSNGLPETGAADRATWRALGQANTLQRPVAEDRPRTAPTPFNAADMPSMRSHHKDVDQVKTLQGALDQWRVTRNLPQIGTDGDFGPVTRMAVIEFQRAQGLPATGIVGPDTWGKLEAVQNRDLASARAPAAIDVPWFSQYDESGRVDRPGDTACYRTSHAMIREFLANNGKQATLNELTDRIDVSRSETTSGDLRATRAAADTARAYVDRSLDAGLPTIVGISHKAGADYNANKATDHFVVITGRGRDEKGRDYYTYNDPSQSDPAKGKGRFYVDEQGKLDKEGKVGKGLLIDRHWEVSEVRTWRELP